MDKTLMSSKFSGKLERARAYAQRHAAREGKPAFHMTCPTGWMNDPNGLSLYNGEIHLFYQHYPYAPHWGDMHWGHCKTRDFLRWTHLPVALAPDEPYDAGGCYSGSAIEENGKHILMYTGVAGDGPRPACAGAARGDGANGAMWQSQCVAVGNGTDYEKSGANPVISAALLPEGCSRSDFRDPKLWRQGDAYFALLGSSDARDNGQVALFASENLVDWRFVSILAHGRPGMGRMWECPDFFELEGRHVLLVSPQFMEAQGEEFHNGNNTMALLGEYDRDTHRLNACAEQAVDYGLDFYAPQTVGLPDGRRVMIGWMQSWDNNITPEGQAWSGVMSLPRELFIRNGRLCQRPVTELDSLRCGLAEHNLALRDERVSPDGVYGRYFDLELELKCDGCEMLELRFAMNDRRRTCLRIHPQSGRVTIDRTFCGAYRDIVCERSVRVKPGNDISLRLVHDLNTIEVFINNGEAALSALIFTESNAEDIALCARGTADVKLRFYTLRET